MLLSSFNAFKIIINSKQKKIGKAVLCSKKKPKFQSTKSIYLCTILAYPKAESHKLYNYNSFFLFVCFIWKWNPLFAPKGNEEQKWINLSIVDWLFHIYLYKNRIYFVQKLIFISLPGMFIVINKISALFYALHTCVCVYECVASNAVSLLAHWNKNARSNVQTCYVQTRHKRTLTTMTIQNILFWL